MTIGISMDQEICLIRGQVSLSLPYWMSNLQTDICGPGRLTNRQVTSRPELWTKLGRNAKLREKQKWSVEKPKLHDARRLRGVYFIDLEDQEFQETIMNARKNWKHQWLPPCFARQPRRVSMGRPVATLMISSLNLRVSWKPVNLQECEWKNLYQNIMRTILQVKGTIRYNITIWYTIFRMPQAMKIPAANAAVDKEWEKLEKIPAWDMTKVRNKSEVIDEAGTKGINIHFASLMDICHLKNAELETKHQKYKGRVVLRGDIVKDDTGSYAVFTEQGSSASQMTAAKSHGYHIQTARMRRTSS